MKFLRVSSIFSILIALVISPACSGSVDGDIDAYCALVEENFEIGLSNSGIELEDLEALLAVSPKEIIKVVEKLRNSLADIAEIDELDQLFAATYDPGALVAQQKFEIYNADECGISVEAIAAALKVNQGLIEEELVKFLESNDVFSSWIEKVSISLVFDGITVQGAEVTFLTSAEQGQALEVCHAISLWMYALKEAEGGILVFDDSREIVRRNASDTKCVEV
tara:strand:- start:198 stop:866 length:669 start_codon:yes stop_codon:yes gene_type:complete